MALITGTCMWAKIQPEQLDKTFAKEKTGGTWSIELVVDKTNEALLQQEGLTHLINVKPDGSRAIKFKRNELKKVDGTSNSPPKVVDSQKNPMTDEVGNGSVVNISFTTYEGFKSKIYPTLQTVQVVKLVPYKRKAKGDDPFWDLSVVEGGYTKKDALSAHLDSDDEPPFESDAKAV